MEFQRAAEDEFGRIKTFYWDLIDDMADLNDRIGWKKGIYPTDEFLKNSLAKGVLYTLKENDDLYACVIVNSDYNEGYANTPWTLDCKPEEVLIPHALGVRPNLQGRGIGRRVVEEVFNLARTMNKKAVRLDILGTNIAAETLYTKCGFVFIEAKTMFYEDTGWTEYKLYEYNL